MMLMGPFQALFATGMDNRLIWSEQMDTAELAINKLIILSILDKVPE